ncbi:hypothetical protein [Streptomyces sp. NRRL F-4489]|uniref:hypothetical protein n=1 Tax=Streptomyces sp. NRRL F-4489 TaxID=1609095 RepID=UPI000B0C75BE|nr:hypothetical protein [Streptomyces sp. NRRL F-4489]
MPTNSTVACAPRTPTDLLIGHQHLQLHLAKADSCLVEYRDGGPTDTSAPS